MPRRNCQESGAVAAIERLTVGYKDSKHQPNEDGKYQPKERRSMATDEILEPVANLGV